jgi:hypothetical protein
MDYPPPSYSEPAPRSGNSLALVSMILGIVAWVFGLGGSCIVGMVLPVGVSCTVSLLALGGLAAAICGHVAQGQIKASGGMQGGGGQATAGIIMGWLGFGLPLCLLLAGVVVIVILALSGPAIGDVFSNIILSL